MAERDAVHTFTHLGAGAAVLRSSTCVHLPQLMMTTVIKVALQLICLPVAPDSGGQNDARLKSALKPSSLKTGRHSPMNRSLGYLAACDRPYLPSTLLQPQLLQVEAALA